MTREEMKCATLQIATLQIKILELEKKMAEQESKYGKWIVDRYCSECEWDKQEADYTSGWRENYCPNCGAKMKG